MKISKRALETIKCSEREYNEWCRRNKKSKSSLKTMQEFCYKIQTGKLIRSYDGHIVDRKEIVYDS